MRDNELDDLLQGLKDAIESEKLAGVSEIYASERGGKKKNMTLGTLEKKVMKCRRCALAG